MHAVLWQFFLPSSFLFARSCVLIEDVYCIVLSCTLPYWRALNERLPPCPRTMRCHRWAVPTLSDLESVALKAIASCDGRAMIYYPGGGWLGCRLPMRAHLHWARRHRATVSSACLVLCKAEQSRPGQDETVPGPGPRPCVRGRALCQPCRIPVHAVRYSAGWLYDGIVQEVNKRAHAWLQPVDGGLGVGGRRVQASMAFMGRMGSRRMDRPPPPLPGPQDPGPSRRSWALTGAWAGIVPLLGVADRAATCTRCPLFQAGSN